METATRQRIGYRLNPGMIHVYFAEISSLTSSIQASDSRTSFLDAGVYHATKIPLLQLVLEDAFPGGVRDEKQQLNYS